MRTFVALRIRLGKEHPFGGWLKLFLNSVYGKLAQRPDTEELVLHPEDVRPCDGGRSSGQRCTDRKQCRLRPHPCCPFRCTGDCGGYKPLGFSQSIFTRASWRIPPSGHVHWAAYVTAHQRTVLHGQLVSDGQEGLSCVQCDTDSCWSTEARTGGLGEALGEWSAPKECAEWRDFVGYAPKTYQAWDARTGEVIGHAKGISKDAARLFEQLREGVELERGVLALKTALRQEKINRKLFVAKLLKRQVRADGLHFGDRVLGEDGRTYPRTLTEINNDE
jgi:hypothetical protein